MNVIAFYLNSIKFTERLTFYENLVSTFILTICKITLSITKIKKEFNLRKFLKPSWSMMVYCHHQFYDQLCQ